MIRALLRRIRESIAPSQSEARIAEEFEHHVAMATQRHIEAGLPAAEAARQARIEFGGTSRFADDARDAIRHRPLENAWHDIRIAARRMRQQPGFSAAIVVTLALGIGATTVVFSIVYGLLLKPLPYPDEQQLVTIQQHWTNQRNAQMSVSPAEYFDYTDQLKAFASFGVYAFGEGDLAGGDSPEHLPVASASAGAMAALRVTPILGRNISPADDVPGHESEVMLTSEIWQRRFHTDPNIVGQKLVFDGSAYTIVGVLPRGFRLPLDMASATPAEMIFPAALDRGAVQIRGSHYLAGVGRIRSGATIAAANADAQHVVAAFSKAFPADYTEATHFTVGVASLKESIIGATRPTLLLLLAASGCLLLIACVNAASLLLAQAETRRQEMAVRKALGAATGRLVRQLLAESLLLATLAGVLGVGVAAASIRLLVSADPFHLPRMSTLQLNTASVLFALGVIVAATIAFGFAPALRLASSDLQHQLRGNGRGASGGLRERRSRRVLIVAEIGIACVLLVSAALLTVSFKRLLATDPGFVVDHVITAPMRLGSGLYPNDTLLTQVVQQLDARVATIPGVVAAGFVAGVPLVAPRGDIGIEIEGHPILPGQSRPQITWQVVTPGYLEAIGMRLRSGRAIDATDLEGHPGSVVINEAMAAKYWPGTSPIGQRFTLGGKAMPSPVTVVGVVGNVRQGGLDTPPVPEMYLAHAQFRFWGGGGMLRSLNLVVRTTGDARAITPALRREAAAIAPGLPIGQLRTMVELRSTSVAMPRFMMVLLLATAVVALTIAVVGLYALVAHSVNARRKEFAIRMALGARPQSVTRIVLWEGAWITAVGLAIGLPAAIGFSKLLQRFLYQVNSAEVPVMAGIAGLLTLIAMLAAYLPARRAASVAPMGALRGE